MASQDRSYKRITKTDLRKLARIAADERRQRPLTGNRTSVAVVLLDKSAH